MKTFADFLTIINSLRVPVGNLGVSRQSMPQLDEPEKFKKALDNIDVSYRSTTVPISSLRLTQGEVNKTKIWKLMKLLRNKKAFPPIFVSSDNFVLDGSHRYVAKLNKNPKGKMEVVQIDMDIRNLLQTIKANRLMFGARYRSLSDSELIE